ALLVGFIVYASTSVMESTIDIKVTSTYGFVTGDLPLSQLDLVKIHMPVRINGENGEIKDISQASRLALEIHMDDEHTLEDGTYMLTFVDQHGLPEGMTDDPYLVFVEKGVTSAYDMRGELERAFQSDRRVRLDEKLGTVTGAHSYDYATVSIALDDISKQLPDGVYDAQIVTESTTPISFLLN
ncbi:MAG: hypothetical protein II504_01640, partial [Clostridia bacterium]|nr:hypothetical protein [Clostridia bacterium]